MGKATRKQRQAEMRLAAAIGRGLVSMFVGAAAWLAMVVVFSRMYNFWLYNQVVCSPYCFVLFVTVCGVVAAVWGEKLLRRQE